MTGSLQQGTGGLGPPRAAWLVAAVAWLRRAAREASQKSARRTETSRLVCSSGPSSNPDPS